MDAVQLSLSDEERTEERKQGVKKKKNREIVECERQKE